MSVLLIAEHNNKEIKPFTLNAISAASQINEDVHVLVIGSNSEEVAKSISQVPNVKKVINVNCLSSLLLCSAINNTDIKLPLLHFLIFEPILLH